MKCSRASHVNFKNTKLARAEPVERREKPRVQLRLKSRSAIRVSVSGSCRVEVGVFD